MIFPEIFARNIGIFSEQEQLKIMRTKVGIVGLGCTGCATVDFLSRAGVGGFVLIDGDRFEESNINRQMYARYSTIGKFKVEVAKNAVLDINPNADVEIHARFLSTDNPKQLLSHCDLIINGVDDPFSMIIIHRTAKELGKPSVFQLSGCIPFMGICSIILPDSPIDYETFMGLQTKGMPLEDNKKMREYLFETVTKNRALNGLKRGALLGPWVEIRLNGGWVPSFGISSNIVSLLGAFEALKLIISRENLPPVIAPDLLYFDGIKSSLDILKPNVNNFWFQGDF